MSAGVKLGRDGVILWEPRPGRWPWRSTGRPQTKVKVPTGALTAVFGLLLIRGQFAPGITLTSTSEIVAWALLFGAAQQAFTILIDRQAQTVLNNVKSTDQNQSN